MASPTLGIFLKSDLFGNDAVAPSQPEEHPAPPGRPHGKLTAVSHRKKKEVTYYCA